MFFIFYFWFFIFDGTSLASIDYENNPKFEEIYRIKIWNLPGGTIEVSSDKGKNWEPVGKVIYPTEKVSFGYAAARWVENGRVAATSVNAIHIKTTDEADGRSKIFSILPKEFLKPPKAYKSYLSPDSSIYTDIPAGRGIFGGGCAPFVGNKVFVARGDYPLYPLGGWFVPVVGDKIYIMVSRPMDYPKEIVFENKFGGNVGIKYFSGEEKIIGKVLRPVLGVGRFEGTKYASVGRIRANHPGVIDVSTSRLGKIGGFQIVPSEHGTGMEYVKSSTQWMVIGPADSKDSNLEGKAPFFKYFINPVYHENSLTEEDWERRVLDHFLVEVRFNESNQWHPMPVWEFEEYYLAGEVPSWANYALQNVTHFRILFPIKRNTIRS